MKRTTIKTERQYQLAQQQIRQFEEASLELLNEGDRKAIRAILADLKEDVRRYEEQRAARMNDEGETIQRKQVGT